MNTQTANIEHIANKTDIPKYHVKLVLAAQAELMTTELRTNSIYSLLGVGKIISKTVAARKGRNPKTGDIITIPETKRISLRSSQKFKDAVNQ